MLRKPTISKILTTILALSLSAAGFAQAPADPIEELLTSVLRGDPQNLNKIWRVLDLNPRMTGWQDTLNCVGDCDAQVISQAKLLPEDGNDTILRACVKGGKYCRLVILHHGARWQVVDYMDTEHRYRAPEVRVVPTESKRWLVVTGDQGGGTGVALDVDEWYEFRDGKFQVALTLMGKGRDTNQDPSRYFFTRFVRHRVTAGKERLEFAYNVEIKNGPAYNAPVERLLWNEERTVTYSRALGQAEFKFDPTLSTISQEFAEKVFGDSSLNDRDFLRFAKDSLLTIARNLKDPRRQWLKDLLDRGPNTPEVKILRAALAAAR